MTNLRTIMCALSSLSILAISGPILAQASEGPELVIEDFIGTIKWENASGDVFISMSMNENKLDIDKISGGLVVNGGIENPDGNECKSYYGSYDLSFFGKKKQSSGKLGGYKNLEDYPILDITLPTNTTLVIRNSIVFTTGEPDIGEADLDLVHCGKINLGNVAGALLLESRGSADVTLGDANNIDAEIKGSTDIEAQIIGGLRYKSWGSGDLEVQQTQNATVKISGSGDVEIEDVLGFAELVSSGSGDIDIGTVNGELGYSGSGSGDLSIDKLGSDSSRNVALRSAGSGDVSIGDGSINSLKISASGSSNINVDGTVQNADIKASGSSDIYLGTVVGEIRRRTSGSSDIHIDRRG